MIYGTILNIQRHCVHDGPGLRTTVFFKGCPLRCEWCCNPESQSFEQEYMYVKARCIGCKACEAVCQENACKGGIIDPFRCKSCGLCAGECYSGALKVMGSQVTVSQVMDEILRDEGYYEGRGGVTVSGGEAFAQPEFLRELLEACKRERIHTLVETCGCFSWEAGLGAAALADMIYFDIKHGDEEGYRKYTGASMKPVVDNLRNFLALEKKVTVRIPIVKGCNGDEETLGKIGAVLYGCGYKGQVHLLPYHAYGSVKYEQLGRSYGCTRAERPSGKEMKACIACFRERGFEAVCYG